MRGFKLDEKAIRGGFIPAMSRRSGLAVLPSPRSIRSRVGGLGYPPTGGKYAGPGR